MRAIAACLMLALLSSAGADQTDQRLAALFERLRASGDAAEAMVAEREVWAIWLESGDAAVDRLGPSDVIGASS